jgi:hypothetical protein
MIVLVPISMFNVPFMVASGRPYSRLELRVLQDIAASSANEPATLQSLRDTFQIHERLLIEAVVTLVGAGWVAVANGREASFVLTDAGLEAVTSGKDPASVQVSPAIPCSVVMDRTTGQLARRNEVRPVIVDERRGFKYPFTPVRILRNSLDEAQVQKIVPRNSGEWVRSIGRARLTTFRRYLPVLLDLETETFVGLPRGWESALGSHIVEVGLRWADENGESDTKAIREKETTAVSIVDVLEGAVSHDGVLEQVLDAAEAHVFIASPTMSVEVLAKLKEPLQRTLQRGVRIDVLYGTASSEEESAEFVKLVDRIGYDSVRQRGRDLFRPGREHTGNPAGFLLYDKPDGSLAAVIGNYPWLAEAVGSYRSVHLGGYDFGASIARVAASLWNRLSDQAAADRWRRVAEVCQDTAALIAARDEGPLHMVDAELLVDADHAGAMKTSDGSGDTEMFGAFSVSWAQHPGADSGPGAGCGAAGPRKRPASLTSR